MDDGDLIDDFRKEHGLGESFDREVRRFFFDAIGEPRFLNYVVAYFKDKHITWEVVGTRLGIDRGRWSRWEKWAKGDSDGQKPSWQHIFSFLILVETDPVDVFLEHGRDIRFCGIRASLEFVAMELAKRNCPGVPAKAAVPDVAQWPSLIAALLKAKFSTLRDDRAITDYLRNILPEVKALLHPKTAPLDVALLRRWAGAWFVCWGLFWYALDGILEE